MLASIFDIPAGYWIVALLGLMLLQAASLASAILSERREPAATLAWLMTVTFLPIIGIVAYYAFARARFRRQFHTRAQANRHADEALSMYVHERLGDFGEATLRTLRRSQQGLIALAANSAGSRCGGIPFPGNAVEVYFDAAAKFDSLKAAIRSAQSHIHIQYYIYRGDGAGREIRDLLIERARAGIEVRLLLDGIGSFRTYPAHFFDPLVAAGGQVAVFLPLRFAKIVERVNFRNHRKVAVIDGRVGFVGGMNVGDEYFGLDRRLGRWVDSHVQIRGPAVAELQRSFLTDWLFTTDQNVAEPKYFPEVPPAGDELVQIVSSGPDCRWPTIQQLHFQAITSAAREVLIATPYFIPDQSVVAALETAALRGVDVRVLLPSKSDVRIVTSAARSYYEELLEAGVRIFEYGGGFLHSKTLAVDGRYGSVGSANMDIRSFTLNFEVSAFVYSERFAAVLQRRFETDTKSAVEIDLETFRNRPRMRKLGQSLAQLLSGVL